MPEPVPMIVPRRADGGHRDRLWAHCRAWWEEMLPEAQIIESNHDEGTFNRSKAINGGAATLTLADDDVFLIADSDVISDEGQVRAAIERARETGRLTFAFERYVALPKRMTEQVLR